MGSRRVPAVVAISGLALLGLLMPQAAQARAHPVRSVPVVRSSAAPVEGSVHLVQAGAALHGGAGGWTRITTGNGGGSFEPGLLRTADGKLHIVWVKPNANNTYSIDYTTLSLTGSVLNTGVAVANWVSLQSTPRLVPDGKSIRLIFNGGQDLNNSNKFSLGARYTATSANGTSWNLVNGSLSSHTVFNLNLTATTELDGTPVSSEGENASLWYHVGVDSNIPSTTIDGSINGQAGSGLVNPTLVRDKSGAIYEAWYQLFESKTAYYVEKILPTVGPITQAPHSADNLLADNEPGEAVALAARVGGGVYMAYCVANKVTPCSHIDLWKVGSSSVRVVPGSSVDSPTHVTLSAGAKGRLVVAWFDPAKSVIKVIRTNTHATAWGASRTVAPPVPASDLAYFRGLFSESSSGRIDLIANLQKYSGGAPTAMYHTQVLAGLSLKASATKISHTHSTTLKFTVTDAGEPVANASVSFLGHVVHTNSHGIAKLTIAKGQKKGTKTATASKSLYYKATVSVKIV